jgi:hypothetical protein
LGSAPRMYLCTHRESEWVSWQTTGARVGYTTQWLCGLTYSKSMWKRQPSVVSMRFSRCRSLRQSRMIQRSNRLHARVAGRRRTHPIPSRNEITQ